MRNLIIGTLLLLLIGGASAQTISREDILADLKVFTDSLPLRHKNLFAKMTREEFAQWSSDMRKKENLDAGSLAIEMMKLAVRTGDEHLAIQPAYTFVFPIRFDYIGGFVVIVASDSLNKMWQTYRVTAINKVPMDVIRKRFSEIVNTENASFFEWTWMRLLNKPLILKALGIVEREAAAEFSIVSPTGVGTTATILSVEPSKYILTIADPLKKQIAYRETQSYGFFYVPDKKILYFNYRSCSERKDWPFYDFNKELFTVIEQEKPAKLILDLRQNSGGNSGILSPFIKSIRKSELNRPDRFYVLIAKPVFSSAVMNAVDLKRNTKATFIGEETGGNINHYGEVKVLSLNRTGIKVSYSTKYWETWKGHDGGLKPDVELKPTYQDFIWGVDPVLDAAIRGK